MITISPPICIGADETVLDVVEEVCWGEAAVDVVGFVGLAPEVEGGAGFHVVRSIEGFGNVVKFYFPTEQMQFITSVF